MLKAGQYIYLRLQGQYLPAEIFQFKGKTFAQVPGDLQQTKHQPNKNWLPVPDPLASWQLWNDNEPTAGNYVWFKDQNDKVHELGYTIGKPGNMAVVMPIDPTYQITSDLWQPVLLPNF